MVALWWGETLSILSCNECWAADQGRVWGAAGDEWSQWGGWSDECRSDWDKQVEKWDMRYEKCHSVTESFQSNCNLTWLGLEVETNTRGEQCRARANYLARCAGRSHCTSPPQQCAGYENKNILKNYFNRNYNLLPESEEPEKLEDLYQDITKNVLKKIVKIRNLKNAIVH